MNLNEYIKTPVKEYQNRVKNNPLVSVCVQTYNHENYISDCLDGILNQKTDFDFEILLGEDESSDGTRDICIKYAEKYPDKIFLFLHRRENNIMIDGNPTGRFNFHYNLNKAKGKYIAICEGDDYWIDTYKLQKQVDFLESNPGYSLCAGGFIEFDTNSGNRKKIIQILPNTEVEGMGYKFSLYDTRYKRNTKPLTLVFRNGIFNPDELLKYKYGGDTKLVYHLLKDGWKGFYFTSILGCYRIHKGGVISMKRRVYRLRRGYNSHKELYQFNNDEYSRYTYISHLANLLNYNIYNRYPSNTLKSKIELFNELFSLIRNILDLQFLFGVFLPPKILVHIKKLRSLSVFKML